MNPEIPNRFYRISVKALILDETRTKFLVVQEDNGKWVRKCGALSQDLEQLLRKVYSTCKVFLHEAKNSLLLSYR